MVEIFEYCWKNLSLSFDVWSKGHKVGTLIGLLVAATVSAIGVGIASVETYASRFWLLGLVIFFLTLVLLITPFRMWLGEKRGAQKAEAKLAPKLKCSFGEDVPGCVRPNTTLSGLPILDAVTGRKVVGTTSMTGTYYRIAVEAAGVGKVQECAARIPWIKRNGRRWFDGENLIMPFVPAESPTCDSKDVVAGRQEHVDILFIANDQILITTKGFIVPTSINFPEMFRTAAEYLFHVEISSPDSTPITQDYKDFPIAATAIGMTREGRTASL